MRLITKTTKAFSLLELLIVMAVISIIMSAAAPGVDRWIARYRAQAFISTLVSDFAEAKILATTGGAHRSSTSATSTDPFNTAIRFTPTEYQVLTRSYAPVSNTSWSPAEAHNTLIKTVIYPRGVSILKLYSSYSTGTGSAILSYTPDSNPTYVFLSTGVAKDGASGNMLISSTTETCGGVTLPPMTLRVNITVDQQFSPDLDYYRIMLDSNGDYGVCYATNTNFPSQGHLMNSFQQVHDETKNFDV